MARIRRSDDLGSREARRSLKVRTEPYWHRIEPGLFLGYRKSKGGGCWIARRYRKKAAPGEARYAEESLALADDHREADGAEVLTFSQAQRQLLEKAHEQALDASGQRYTVADAVRDYVDWCRRERKSADDTEQKLNAYVVPHLGEKRLTELTGEDLDAWVTWALKRRRRTKKGPRPEASAAGGTESKAVVADRARRRKATLNRVINALKACLNHAAGAKKVQSRDAWARIKKFRSADSARLRWLTVEEAQRLQNAASPDLRALIAAGLNTGCRAGELLALRAGDYDRHSETLLIADSKSSKPRRVPLTYDGVALFERLTAGKVEDETLFHRADGSSWYRVALVRAMHAACAAGKVRPAATFHTLRHTYASHLVQAGVPLIFVAEALGHSDVRMVTRHYGHLAPSHVADAIRAALPRFGNKTAADTTVRALHQKFKSA